MFKGVLSLLHAHILKFFEPRVENFPKFWKEKLHQQKTIDMAFLPIYKRENLQGYINTKLFVDESVNVIGDFWFNNTGATELVTQAYKKWRDS